MGAEQAITTERNEDVQVLKLYDGDDFSIAKTSVYPSIDQEQCKPDGKTWAEVKAWDTTTAGPLPVWIDCTEAFSATFGYPSMRAVAQGGSRTRPDQVEHYGYVAFSNSGGAYYTKTVELVVKQSVIDAPTFHGIGFYLNEFQYPFYKTPPPPGPNDGNAHFVSAAQVRAQADQYPAATLTSGEKARVIKVILPMEYAIGGSSYVRAFYFRPFAEFVDGGEKHQRWDHVKADYFVGMKTSFNRETDVLAR